MSGREALAGSITSLKARVTVDLGRRAAASGARDMTCGPGIGVGEGVEVEVGVGRGDRGLPVPGTWRSSSQACVGRVVGLGTMSKPGLAVGVRLGRGLNGPAVGVACDFSPAQAVQEETRRKREMPSEFQMNGKRAGRMIISGSLRDELRRSVPHRYRREPVW